MMAKTHLALGFLAGLFGITLLHPSNQILFLSLVVLASVFPDIDLPDSKIGRKARPLNIFFEHRGFFHSLFAAVLFALLVYLLSQRVVYLYAVAVGYISHIAIDAMTYGGVMLFHPLSKRKLRGFMKTGSIGDFVLFLLFLGLGIWKLFHI